jgi:hypothetical protein
MTTLATKVPLPRWTHELPIRVSMTIYAPSLHRPESHTTEQHKETACKNLTDLLERQWNLPAQHQHEHSTPTQQQSVTESETSSHTKGHATGPVNTTFPRRQNRNRHQMVSSKTVEKTERKRRQCKQHTLIHP